MPKMRLEFLAAAIRVRVECVPSPEIVKSSRGAVWREGDPFKLAPSRIAYPIICERDSPAGDHCYAVRKQELKTGRAQQGEGRVAFRIEMLVEYNDPVGDPNYG